VAALAILIGLEVADDRGGLEQGVPVVAVSVSHGLYGGIGIDRAP